MDNESNKINVELIEEGCNLLREASAILNDLSTNMFKVKEYCSRGYLMLKELSVEDNIEICKDSLENASTCLDDYVEDLQMLIKENTYE